MESSQSRTERRLRPSGARAPTPAEPALVGDIGAIYTAHAGFVWRVLRGMGIAQPQIEDAVQDVFIVVHRRYPEFDHRSKLQTWLFEICYRVAQAHRRRQASARVLVSVDDELRAQTRSPAEQAEQHEDARLLFALLDRLDDAKRMVLLLAEVEGMTAPEISETLGIPLNTVYSRMRRARAEFSQALELHQRSQR